MKYTHYLFDLDGTLTDPGLGIKNSIRYALDAFGLPALDDATLNAFIGPPLIDSFCRYCSVSREDAVKLLALYREYFADRGIFENTVYDGIEELLAELCRRGASVYLATSKPEPFAIRILEHFGLLGYFSFVGGSTMDETRTDKADVIAYVLEKTGLDASSAVMIGDRRYDVIGGKKNQLATVGVLFGYGDREELAEADALVSSPEEILSL